MTISYQELLEYVSENFQCVKAGEGLYTLVCNLHGEVRNFRQDKGPKEMDLMLQIGLHMDLVDHDEWKKEGERESNFDGGEQWQEEFATQPILDLPNLVHKVPGCKWSLEIVVENLREQIQLCYNHLEECGK